MHRKLIKPIRKFAGGEGGQVLSANSNIRWKKASPAVPYLVLEVTYAVGLTTGPYRDVKLSSVT